MSKKRRVVEADPLPDALATYKACYDSLKPDTNTAFESNATQQSKPFGPKVVRSSDYQQPERVKKAEVSEERSVVGADPLPDALATQKACYDSFESATNKAFESNATQQSKPFDPKVVRSSDYHQLERFKKAEKCRLHSSKEEVDRETEKRNIDIIQAIYLDDAPALKKLVDPALGSKEIQLRILEAIELNSLMCLDVLCEEYQNQQTLSKKNGELFHRRCGLSFWPIDERPKVTALHVLASRVKSAKALDVLMKRPKFFQDFADMQDSHGSTPLLLAIKCNNMDVVRRLLTTKPDVNKKNHQDETPILIAALKDNADAIQEIINTYNGPEEKTNLEEIMRNIDGKGHSILYPASQSGTQEVLNLILERDWWQDFLEQEKNKEEDWHTFICNISASGCINLLQQDKIKNELLDVHHEKTRKSDVTPLMRAAEADQEEVVKLILSILQSSGNDALAVCDSKGRNVFHYAVENPNVLRYLCEMSQDKKAINHMDNSGKSPMKLAAVKELTESFELLSKYAKSEEDMFAAHIIHYVKIEILENVLRSWKRKDPAAASRLLNGDHDEHQPFLEAAKRGNVKLMKFLLKQGANHLQRTSTDKTAIHCAAQFGKREPVKYLINQEKFREMIDFTDDVNVTAAGYATQAGHSDVLRYLLDENAQMKGDKKTGRLNILDSAYGYFKTAKESMKEIIKFCTKDKGSKMLQELFEDSHFGADNIMAKLIEETPEVAIMIFDFCVSQEEIYDYRSYCETEMKRKVVYLLFPFKRKNDGGKAAGKLAAVESMVNNKRDNCLGHPLVTCFLNEKLKFKIRIWLYLNFIVYLIFLGALTAYGVIQSQETRDLKSPGMITFSVITSLLCLFHLCKEMLQMKLTKMHYFRNFENWIELTLYICTVIYVMPVGSTKSYGQVAAGAVSVFFAWINFSLIMKRFLLFGIYIIMAKRVFLTVCKVLPLVLLVVFAFSLSFLLLMSEDQGFRNIGLSILTTFVMMSGEIDYRETFLTGGKVHALQKILLFLFIIMISIAIMNLLTGLAIGDTNEIMRRSKEEKILHKAELVLAQEKNSHQFAYLGLAQCDSEDEIITEYSDEEMSTSWTLQQWRKAFGGDEIEERLKAIAKEKKNDYKKFDEFKEEMKILGEEMFSRATEKIRKEIQKQMKQYKMDFQK